MRPRQRLGLLTFGVCFALLFAVMVVVEGIGHRDIPADAVALVEDTPQGTREIGVAEFGRQMRRVGVEAGLGRAPRPTDPDYEELRETVLTSLISTAWTEGLAQERGVSVHPVEVEEAFREYRGRFLASKGAYERYLAQTGQSTADLKDSVRIGLLQSKIGREAASQAPKPSGEEIDAYYEEAKPTQFTQPARRDVRIVAIEDRSEAEEAKASLERDDSPKSWERVVKEHSEDPSAKERGGLFEGLSEEGLGEPLDSAFFTAPPNQVEGPLATPAGYYVFEVVKETPEGAEALDEDTESRIRSQLAQQALDDTLEGFQYDFESLWRSRTLCAPDYLVEICRNFEGSARPPGAERGCYEADPEEPPQACPAPVAQLQPALPGSVSMLEPQGERLAQRPQPAGLAPAPEPPPFMPGAP